MPKMKSKTSHHVRGNLLGISGQPKILGALVVIENPNGSLTGYKITDIIQTTISISQEAFLLSDDAMIAGHKEYEFNFVGLSGEAITIVKDDINGQVLLPETKLLLKSKNG